MAGFSFVLHGKIRVIKTLRYIGLASLIVVITLCSLPKTLAEQKLPTPVVITPPPLPELPPIFVHVADCESGEGKVGGGRQFNADGSVVRGRVNHNDIGKYQINLDYNGATALKLGYDIFTLEGNTRMAYYLYKHGGLQPWSWSKPCWGQFVE